MMKKIIQLISLFVLAVTLLTSCKQKTESGFTEINGTKLYYEMSGEGTPMIFLHGFACDHSNWENQVKYFSKKFKVITYDMRGFGKSTVPDTVQYSHETDLEALMDFLKIDKAVLVGHSLGGIPSFYFTLDYPDRVKALILGEGGGLTKEMFKKKYKNLFEELGKATIVAKESGIEAAKETWLNMTILKPAIANPLSKEKLMKMTNDYSGWHWIQKDPEKYYKILELEELSEIKVPTLLMVGENSLSEYQELSDITQDYIKDSKKVIIKNSGHMLNLENPEQFNEEIELFLNENNIK